MEPSLPLSAPRDPPVLTVHSHLSLRCHETRLLLIEWDRDHNCAHHAILLEIPLRTVRVCDVAADAGLSNSPVGLNGLKIRVLPLHDHFGIDSAGLPQALLLEFGFGPILLVDRPEVNELVSNLGWRVRSQRLTMARTGLGEEVCFWTANFPKRRRRPSPATAPRGRRCKRCGVTGSRYAPCRLLSLGIPSQSFTPDDVPHTRTLGQALPKRCS